MSTYTGSCIAVGPRSSGTIMASDWEHLLSCGIAQYDTTPDSTYPFVETHFKLDTPTLEDTTIQQALSGKEGKWRWFPFFTDINDLSCSDRQRVKDWIETTLPVVQELEKRRSEALKAFPLAAFKNAKQLDFTKMDFSQAAIVERVNAVAHPTIINLKACEISDEDFAKMTLSKTLNKLILSYNPVSDKSLEMIERAKLDQLEVLCLAHTNISDEAVREASPRLKSTAQKLDIFR